ncbi:flavodoxin [Sutterella sp.]|uniref:flavodoxin n=1 Tax=Sutterella sp. TaxID=1981025 RepID=UPI0026E0482A|nr:flavodoxin [Sutterella sp.]MDO5532860.1 flavodoxin [Sutterella sp.]
MVFTRRSLLSASIASVLGALGVTARTASAAEKAPGSPRRIAVVFVSKTGHTKSVAEAIRHFTGADVFQVETVEPYPEEYRPATEVVKAEIEQGIKRPLKPLAIDLSKYDTVILGTPTWWHRPAQPLKTWMESVDLTEKFVLTFSTHGGGGLMEVRSEFESLLPGVKLGTHFLSWGGVRRASSDVKAWLAENGLV